MRERRDFWSNRRAAVKAEEAAEAQAQIDRVEEAEQAALSEKDDAEILAELNLPDPDDLTLGDDVSGFMAKAVPDRLRRRALRKLWKLNPVLANVDGLVDYGEDFTDSAMVIENLQTTYQVGKGMLSHIEEMARQAEQEELMAEHQPDPHTDTVGDDEPTDAPALTDVTVTENADKNDTIVQLQMSTEPEDNATEIASLAPRRMRFAFET